MVNNKSKNDINNQGFRLVDYIKKYCKKTKNKKGDVIISLKQERKT